MTAASVQAAPTADGAAPRPLESSGALWVPDVHGRDVAVPAPVGGLRGIATVQGHARERLHLAPERPDVG